VQCLVDEQTEFERDALKNMQPMQVVANQWRHVVILAATKDDTSGTMTYYVRLPKRLKLLLNF